LNAISKLCEALQTAALVRAWQIATDGIGRAVPIVLSSIATLVYIRAVVVVVRPFPAGFALTSIRARGIHAERMLVTDTSRGEEAVKIPRGHTLVDVLA